MSETPTDYASRLRSVHEHLTDLANDDMDGLVRAGAALEEVASILPPDIPGVGSLLGLTLDALQAAYTDAAEQRPGLLDGVREAVATAVDRLGPGGEAREDAVERAGARLWSLLGRNPNDSPFAGEECTRSVSAAVGGISPEDRLAVLVSSGPDDVVELEALADWLAAQARWSAISADASAHARSAADLIATVIEGNVERPQQALDEAAEAFHAMLSEAPESADPLEGEREDRSSVTGECCDDEPACLQFEGDAVLLGEFITEAMEHIEAAEAGMLAVEADPADREAINAVFRGFHTIKGTAGFLGLAHLQALAHLAENLLERVREGEIELADGYADLALASSDMLREMLDDLRGWREGALPPPPPGFTQLTEHLETPGDYAASSAPPDERGDETDSDQIPATASSQAVEAGKVTARGDRAGSTRVRTDRLDALINMVGELVIANAMLAEDDRLRDAVGHEVERKIDQISKITRELQDVSMALRMVPLKATFHKMARVVRDVARKSAKRIELVTEGDDTEIDRNMVESITDPLMHMVRNAADHGIEPSDERSGAGKSPEGTVTLRAYHSTGSVVIEIADDGRGLDLERIREKAVAAGEIEEGAQLADEEICRLIFSAGLSTAREVTDVSGRGVGMDVVRRNIEAMRGRVDISSETGRGSTFSIRLPLTLAIIDGMLMRVDRERYIIPTVSIQHAFCPDTHDLKTLAGSAEMVDFRGEMIPLLRIHDLFAIEREGANPGQTIAVVAEHGGEKFALLVDELLGQQQIVIKSLGEGLADAETVAGAAILGDGSVGLILDVDGLVRVAQNMQKANIGGGRCAE